MDWLIVLIATPLIIGIIAGLWILPWSTFPWESLLHWVLWGGLAYLGLNVLQWLIGPFARMPDEELYAMQISDERHKVPETNADGTVIAYRYFTVNRGVLGPVTINGAIGAPEGYRGGWLTSDRVPTLNNTNGIYAAKTPDSPILCEYRTDDLGHRNILAKVELSGRVVEGEYGYRGQHCRVVEILGR